MKKKRSIVIMICLLILVTVIILGFDTRLVVTNYIYENNKIPDSFNGYRIVQISDFHCEEFGRKEEKLIAAVKECKPDMIVFTGDLIDGNHKIDNAYYLLNGLAGIAPMYAIEGNHESDNSHTYLQLLELFRVNNIEYLGNEYIKISKGNDSIHLFGLTEQYYNQYKKMYDVSEIRALVKLAKNEFNILLYHYANEFDFISMFEFDLVLAGHVHGGIIRLPFVGGLLANDMTFFPKYDSGIYYKNNTTMFVSRGLGDADIPRFNNRPEVVCIELKKSD